MPDLFTGVKSLFGRAPAVRGRALVDDSAPLILEWDGERMYQLAGKSLSTADDAGMWRRTGTAYRDIPATEVGYAQAYCAVVWLQRAADIRAHKVSELLHQGQVISKSSGKAIPDHPLMAALERSRKTFGKDIYRVWEYWRILTGQAFLLPVQGEVPGLPMLKTMFGFRVLNSLVTDVMVQRGQVLGFQYSGDDYLETYAPDRLIYDYTFNPFDDNLGKSMLSAVLDDMNIQRGVIVAAKNYIRRGMTARVVFAAKNATITKPDMDQLLADLKEQVVGPENAGRPLVLPAALESTVLNPPPPVDQQAYIRQAQQAAATATGIPLPLIVFEQNPYQLSPEQRIGLYDTTLIPEAQDMAYVVDMQLLPYFDSNPDHEFKLPVEEIRSNLIDPQQRAEMVKNRFHSGLMTFNQAQQSQGYEPLPGGDFYILPSGMVAVPQNQLANVNELTRQPQPMAFQAVPQLSPPVPTPQLPAGPGVQPIPAKASSVGTPAAYAILDLANDAQLIAYQHKVKQLFPDLDGIRWAMPGSFHVTLFHAPLISDDHLERIMRGLDENLLQPMTLKIGPLSTFENTPEKPLILPVEMTPELKRLQAALVKALDALEVPVSEYSQPAAYKPHVTLAYLDAGLQVPDVPDVLTVKTQTISFCRSGYSTIVSLPMAAEVVDAEPGEPETNLFSIPDAADELARWQKYVHNGTHRKRPFKALVIAPDIAGIIQSAVSEGGTARIERAFERARELLHEQALIQHDYSLLHMLKAYTDTRSQFVSAMLRIIRPAQQDESSRRQFAGAMRSTTNRFGLMAFRDGLTDGGFEGESLDNDMLTIYRAWQAETSEYITNFGSELFKEGGISENEVEIRAQLWANKTLDDIYFAGLRIAGASIPGTWRLGSTIDHCESCVERDGKTMTIDEWGKIGFPRDRRLACGGWQCDCDLFDKDGKRLGAR